MCLEIRRQRVLNRAFGTAPRAARAYTGNPATYALITPDSSRSNTTGNRTIISFHSRLPKDAITEFPCVMAVRRDPKLRVAATGDDSSQGSSLLLRGTPLDPIRTQY